MVGADVVSETEIMTMRPDEMEKRRREAIELSTPIPMRYAIVPSVAAATGFSLGLVRGSRKGSLQFLAENAHRAPRTLEGWYFYKKTKNYRVMLAGLKGGAAEGARLGAVGMMYVLLEGAAEWVGGGTGLERVREVVAGVGSAGVVGLMSEFD